MKDQTVESVAYDLKENGYATHAIHNHRAAFYSRNEVYPNLGFDDFTALEYMPAVEKTPTNWAKDGVLKDQILQALDVTEDQADLVFTVSVQGHGKYPMEPELEDPAVTVEACPDEAYRWALEYYVNQIHEMDAFVGDLIQELEARDERTVLVLYGDHLPALGLEAENMESSSLYRTEYIIWDNFGLEQQDEALAAYQLSATVLGRLGITTGLMTAFQQTCREEPTYRADLRMLQYDALYGKGYCYEGEARYRPTEMEMGMVPIEITGMEQRAGDWFILGENFTPYCVVTQNGQLLDTEYEAPWLLRVTEEPNTADYRDLEISVVDKHNEVLSNTE
ncbi:MAG: LTA synthase family protein [Dysosmobacter welbionis]